MKKKILIWLGYKVKVDNLKVRRAMDSYFYHHEWKYETTITKIETFETKKGLEILIETHRPGILIGKAGSFIDGLKKWIQDDIKREDIFINLKECKMWHQLYKN